MELNYEIERLRHAKTCMDRLAEGTDPTSGEVLPEDTALGNVQLSRCFFLASDILRKVIENNGFVGQRIEKLLPPFSLPSDMYEKVEITSDPAMIKRFTDRINELADISTMRKLKVTALTSWLVNNGYLCEEVVNDKKRKIPTKQGEELGIRAESREGQYGSYLAILYNENAQRLLVNNLDQIIALSNGN